MTTSVTAPVIVNAKINLAGDAQELVNAAEANPQLDAWLLNQFGAQISTAAHTTGGALLGMIISWLISRYAIQITDPKLTEIVCGLGVLIGSSIYNTALAFVRKGKANAT
jgi:hypothetical protein